MPVLNALAGMQAGPMGGSVMPMPLASGAVHCVKLSVPVMVPVTVASAGADLPGSVADSGLRPTRDGSDGSHRLTF
jgi:hypothetical protein